MTTQKKEVTYQVLKNTLKALKVRLLQLKGDKTIKQVSTTTK